MDRKPQIPSFPSGMPFMDGDEVTQPGSSHRKKIRAALQDVPHRRAAWLAGNKKV